VDIVTYAVVVAHSALEKKELTSSLLKERFSLFTEEELQKFNFSYGTVGELLLLPGSEKRRMYIFQSNANLFNVMKILTEHQRVLVQHVSKSMFSFMSYFDSLETKICSQTDIIKYICAHIKDSRFTWGTQINKSMEDLNLPTSYVSITLRERAIDGFLKMLDANATACAILHDSNGQLMATLSASDLRGITAESLDQILQPVMEFFRTMTGDRPPPPLTCESKQPLLDVLNKMLLNKKHECWLVDDSFRPISLITMTNIIAKCTNQTTRPSF